MATTRRRTLTATMIALALPFGLAACGDDSEDNGKSDSQSQETTDGGNPLDPDGGDSDDQDSDDQDSDDQDTDNTDINSGDRASKEEFQDGMEAMLDDLGYDRESMKAQGLSDEQLDDYYSCIVDTSYDDLSDTFVNGVADNNQNAPLEANDAEVLQSAISECVDSLQF